MVMYTKTDIIFMKYLKWTMYKLVWSSFIIEAEFFIIYARLNMHKK